ncbi:putative Protein ECT2 [Hypsibius exemplaris]|uniref:Protein ECT2 n=1 Tax=Hypsibius exemplaris TaxID=2072580 RepID=A0A1W0W9W0_HYPEX|nr:putative Protein ECT2 [Hypsibius exemplaris]
MDAIDDSSPGIALQFCLLDDVLQHNQVLLDCIRNLGASYYSYCEEALNAASRKRTDKRIVFVAAHFEGKRFKKTKSVTSQIVGPPALMSFYESWSAAARRGCDDGAAAADVIPVLKRPIYATIMNKVVAVVAGYAEVQNAQIIKQIHNMGGFVMKRLTSSSIRRHRPTHLIAHSALCKAYHVARAHNDTGLQIVSEEWIRDLWSRCTVADLHSPLIASHPPAAGAYAWARNITFSLVGFDTSTHQHWTAWLESAGGFVADHKFSSSSTNIFLLNDDDDSQTSFFRCRLLQRTAGRCLYRLKFDREVVQLDVQDEQWVCGLEFLRRSRQENIFPTPLQRYSVIPALRDEELAHAAGSGIKRGLFAGDVSSPSPKRQAVRVRRRSSVTFSDVPDSDAMLRTTETPSRQLKTLALSSPPSSQQQFRRGGSGLHLRHHARLMESDENVPADLVAPVACQRQQRAMELLQTERNYIRLLRSLLENVVGPLEAEGSHGKSGCLLAITDLDIIFGRLPVICRIHEKIASEISAAIDPWSSDCSLGAVYAKFADDIAKVYLPYVNAYDDSRRFLQDTMKHKPKLQAFVNRCLALPEFSRQSLADILIRPVQRLPTILLLLKDLQKHTEDCHPDYTDLAMAVAALDDVLKAINESGRVAAAPLGGSYSVLSSNASSSLSLASTSRCATDSPVPSRKAMSKRNSVDGGGGIPPPDSTSLKAWEKARKLAFRTSSRVSRVFAFGSKSASGSGLKRAASTLLASTAKNAKSDDSDEQ